MPSEVLRMDSDPVDVEVHPLLSPVREPLLVRAGLAEPLHLHLLELAGAEDEVLRGDLVAEALADLGDAEGNFHAAGLDDILEIDVDALGSLRPQIDHGAVILGRTDMGCEHQVEVAWSGERVLVATVRARPVQVDLVRSEAGMADLAVHHRVGEVGNMAARLPDRAVHQDRGVDADNVVVQLRHLLPPHVADVVLQRDAQRAVVIGAIQSTINLAGLKNETTPLA